MRGNRGSLMLVAAVVMGACMGLLAPVCTAEQMARGVVFNDRNGNGAMDRWERGIRGVAVSNGREVVDTDRKGRYELPVTDDTILFVIKPEGWMTEVDDDGVPRFYYVHKPNGSPKMKFEGVAPTGPLPESVDFPLSKVRDPGEYTVLLFGDPQPRNQTEVDYVAHDLVEELVGTDARFGVLLGDLAFDDLSVLPPLSRAVGVLGIPWYAVHGNHDTNQDTADDALSDETWERVYGPSYYSFNYGKVHFVALDSVMWTGDGYHGELGERQLEFVRNDLARVPKDTLIVLLMHIPVMQFRDREALFEIVQDWPHTFSVSAHTHTHSHHFLGEDHGWHGAEPHHHMVNVTACGSWWTGVSDEHGIPHTTMADGAPNGYTVATFEGNEYRITFKAARRPADHQMLIHAPEVVKAAEAGSLEVLANVFNGSERSTTEMRLGESSPWMRMKREAREDPQFLRMKSLEEKLPPEAGRNLPKPGKTGHMWVGTLPANPRPGLHLIQVRTTDMFGQTYLATRTIRVE